VLCILKVCTVLCIHVPLLEFSISCSNLLDSIDSTPAIIYNYNLNYNLFFIIILKLLIIIIILITADSGSALVNTELQFRQGR
jgi:hypothetical protein